MSGVESFSKSQINSVWSLEFIVSQVNDDQTNSETKMGNTTIAFKYLDFPPVVLFHLDAPLKIPRGKSCAFIVTDELLKKESSFISPNLQILQLSSSTQSNEKDANVSIDCPNLAKIFDSAGPMSAIPVIDKKWYSFPSIDFMMEITVKLKKRGTLNMFSAASKEPAEVKNGGGEGGQVDYLQARSLNFASSMNLLESDPIATAPSDEVSSTATSTVGKTNKTITSNGLLQDSSNTNLKKVMSTTYSPPPSLPKPIAATEKDKISLVEKEKLKQLLRERYRVDRLKNLHIP